MNNYEITIVGAGFSGITAANRFLKQGRKDLLLVDKSKSVGGRLATRRVAGGKADHGAQFFTVRTKEFEEEVEGWLDQGRIKRWFGDEYPRYTAVDGMNSLAKHLAKGIPTSLHTTVTRIVQNTSGFRLYDENGNEWQSEKVLLTMPVPQIIELLKDSEVRVDSSVYNQLKKVVFEPTYVGIYKFNHPTNLPENGHVDTDLPEGMERMVDHEKKGISKETTVSIYMKSDWSRKYYGEDYVLSLIKEKAASYLDWKDLESEQLKRWRYAQAKNVVQSSYLDLSGEGTLVAAGDAFLRENDEAKRTRLESAYLSGKDAAASFSW